MCVGGGTEQLYNRTGRDNFTIEISNPAIVSVHPTLSS